jgi:hypothetical protein
MRQRQLIRQSNGISQVLAMGNSLKRLFNSGKKTFLPVNCNLSV